MNCKVCNDFIPEKRLAFLVKNKKALTCIKCSVEDKVVGVQVTDAKDTRSIQVLTKDEAEKLLYTAKQSGVQFGKK